ncbi:MAG: MBL fold metallo-hydrolase [Sphingobacteriaceae bacterium]|nr:MAG: MBL fold metallo-hydrolase [Sphingobacteriaceae bacterium]
MPYSPNFNGKVFVNPIPTKTGFSAGFLNILKEYRKDHPNRTPRLQPGPFKADLSLLNNLPADDLRITLIGHSSTLIEIDGKRILTDPVWVQRASPFSFLGPKRFFPAPIALDNLPPIDGIIISHDHYDHFDKKTVKILGKRSIPFFCSLGVGKILNSWGIPKNQITEFDWWQEKEIWPDFKLAAAPARHFSGRGLRNRNTTLWASYVIKGPKHKVYFGADSGMHPLFKEIGQKYGPFDIAMLEIGASNPLWADIHMGPDLAAEAFLELNANLMMPIHWGTFNLAFHAWTQPIERLLELSPQKNIKLLVPKPGETYIYNGKPYVNKWWEPFK